MSVNFEERFSRLILHHARIRRRRECLRACLRGETSAREVVHDAGLQKRFGVNGLDGAKMRAENDVDAALCGGFFLWTSGDEHWFFPGTEVFDAPWVIFGIGLHPAPPGVKRRVCVVGSRAASKGGMETAHACAAHLAQRGACIVSGGALGIDAAAHAGALHARGVTWVFFGSGISRPYPERNRNLFGTVAARGGACFSAGMNHPPDRAFFVQRNAYMAACSDAVVVVEARAGSGSLHTARFALSFGRPVFVFPGSPGCSLLLGQGAVAVRDPEELAGFLESPEKADNAFRNRPAVGAGGGEFPEEIAARTGNTLTEVLQRLQIGELNGDAVRLPGGRWMLLRDRE